MPRIDSPTLLKEFYEKNKDNYPHISLEQMKECCSTQFLYVRKQIEGGELPVIRLKYFGTFVVFQKRAIHMKKVLEDGFKRLLIEPKYYFTKKEMLEKFLTKKQTEPDDEEEFI